MATVQRTERQRREWAELAVHASKRTGDILPRKVYKIAGVEAPANATNRTQRKAELA